MQEANWKKAAWNYVRTESSDETALQSNK